MHKNKNAQGTSFDLQAQKIHDLNEQIGKALARMEELGNEGKVRGLLLLLLLLFLLLLRSHIRLL